MDAQEELTQISRDTGRLQREKKALQEQNRQAEAEQLNVRIRELKKQYTVVKARTGE